MALTEERFAADGSTRIFTPSTTILSQNHVKVDYYYIDKPDDVYYITPDEWDLVNNSIVFKEAPKIGKAIIISISTTGEDLGETLSAVQIVAGMEDDIKEVLTYKTEIMNEASFGMRVHTNSLKDDYTLRNGYNATSTGPILIEDDVIILLDGDSVWSIV